MTNGRLAISKAVCDVTESYHLTPTEIVGILLQLAAQNNKYCLRMERHGTTEKKADEE